MTTEETIVQQGVWRDFGYYVKWWAILVVIPAALKYTTGDFWQGKAQQAIGGLVGAVLAAVVFTLLQNTLNARRRKPVSWLLAFLAAFSVAFAGLFLSA